MDYRKVFAERLNELRKKKRHSKTDFAMLLTEAVKEVRPPNDVPDPAFGSLTVEALYASAKLLNVSTDYLLGLSDNPDRSQ